KEVNLPKSVSPHPTSHVVFSPPLQGGLSRKLLAVYETEGLLLRLVVVLFYNPSEFYFVKPTSPCRGGENRAGDCVADH
ncbi:MAG: hypothetical protein J6M16_00560, partial [Clostridia bacterium]|nr:hypothetical protein [Clostridia bacterium]